MRSAPTARPGRRASRSSTSSGAVILQRGQGTANHLFVVREGAAEIVDDGRVIDEVGEGDVFGMWSLLDQVAPTATVRSVRGHALLPDRRRGRRPGPAFTRRHRVHHGQRPTTDRRRRRDAESRGRPRAGTERSVRSSAARHLWPEHRRRRRRRAHGARTRLEPADPLGRRRREHPHRSGSPNARGRGAAGGDTPSPR